MITLETGRSDLSGQWVGRVVGLADMSGSSGLADTSRLYGPPNPCWSPSLLVLLGPSDPMTRLGFQVGLTCLCLRAHLTRVGRQSSLFIVLLPNSFNTIWTYDFSCSKHSLHHSNFHSQDPLLQKSTSPIVESMEREFASSLGYFYGIETSLTHIPKQYPISSPPKPRNINFKPIFSVSLPTYFLSTFSSQEIIITFTFRF